MSFRDNSWATQYSEFEKKLCDAVFCNLSIKTALLLSKNRLKLSAVLL